MDLADFTRSESEFLKKEDLPQPPAGVVVTIESVAKHEWENKPGEVFLRLNFEGDTKPFVCNKTNARLLAAIFPHVKKPPQLVGKAIELYTDPTVQNRGEVVGGVRIRQAPHSSDDTPF